MAVHARYARVRTAMPPLAASIEDTPNWTGKS